MYDIQIFIEDNGQIGARVQIEDEILYALGDTPSELFSKIKSILEDIKEDKSFDEAKFNKIFMCFAQTNVS